MQLHTDHCKQFNNSYLLVCILSGLYFQPAWAGLDLVTDRTIPVKGHAPTAAPVLDSTSPFVDETLTADPQFHDVDGDAMSPDNTLYEWQVQDSPGGAWRKITDAKPGSDPTSKKYKVWVGYIGKPLRVAVRPGGYSSAVDPYLGEWGYSTATNPVQQGHPPEATNVSISGIPTVGNKLTGAYTYSDAEVDPEGSTLYQWYLAGQKIPNATSKTYTVVSADQGKTLAFSVTPKSLTGMPNVGAEVKSAASAPVQGHPPEAKNVSISGSPTVGNTLTGVYTYSDADVDPEGSTVYKWYRDGQFYASGKTYKLTPDDQHKTLSFSVKPISSTGIPNTGNEVKVNSKMVFVSVNGVKFAKPTKDYRNWDQSKSYCSSLALDGGGWRLPTRAHLKALYKTYPNNQVKNMLGWDTVQEYWTSEQVSGRLAHYSFDLQSGRESNHSDVARLYVVCIR